MTTARSPKTNSGTGPWPCSAVAATLTINRASLASRTTTSGDTTTVRIGLERRLEKLFDRVDANDDGAVDASELTEALAKVDAPRAKKHAGCEASQQPAQPDVASASYASVTVVAAAVAVKQYAAIGAAA